MVDLKRALAAAAAVLEGDYSDWTIWDSFDDLNVAAGLWWQYAVVNKAETVILLIDFENLGARKYAIATKTLGALVDKYWFPAISATSDTEGTFMSMQGTYVTALIHSAGYGNGIAVWKNGDLIKTFSASALGFNADSVYGVSMSKSGNFIIVSGLRTATGNKGWVILVGS